MRYGTKDDMHTKAAMKEETFEEFLGSLQRLGLEPNPLDERTWEFDYLTIERDTKACIRKQSEHTVWFWENRELIVTDSGFAWQQIDSIPAVLDGKNGRMAMSDFLDYMVDSYFMEKAQDI